MISVPTVALLAALSVSSAVDSVRSAANSDSYSQTHRIPAGTKISLQTLLPDPSVNMVIGDLSVDYQHCEHYEFVRAEPSYLKRLQVEMEDCIGDADCTEVEWLPQGIVEVRCNTTGARSSFATALDVMCKYSIKVTETNKYYVTKRITLTFDARAMKASCGANKVVNVSNVVLRGGRSAALCTRSQKLAVIQRISDLVGDCTLPCQSILMSQNASYGCDFVTGLTRTNDLRKTSRVDQMIILYRCVSMNSTLEIYTHSTHRWQHAAIPLIVLLTLSLIVNVGLIYRLFKKHPDVEKSEPLETNNNTDECDESRRPPTATSPYAVHNLWSLKKTPRAPTIDEPSFYVNDNHMVKANADLPSADNDNEYEDVATPSHAKSQPADVVKRTKKGNFLTVDKKMDADRVSTGSYVIFEP